MALRWLFYRDTEGQCRWEVRGSEGPIATSGNIFGSIEDCVADARARGFSGAADPKVSVEPISTVHEPRLSRRAAN